MVKNWLWGVSVPSPSARTEQAWPPPRQAPCSPCTACDSSGHHGETFLVEASLRELCLVRGSGKGGGSGRWGLSSWGWALEASLPGQSGSASELEGGSTGWVSGEPCRSHPTPHSALPVTASHRPWHSGAARVVLSPLHPKPSHRLCYGLNCAPQNSYEVRTPRTSEGDCTWRLGL